MNERSIKNLASAINEVKKKVTFIKKGKKGKQFKYAGSSDVLPPIREAMVEHGIVVFPDIPEAKMVHIANDKGQLTIITQMWFKYKVVHCESGESITLRWYAQGFDYGGEKGPGKAATYAEKTFYLKLFNIPTDESDPDSFQDNPKPAARTRQQGQPQTSGNYNNQSSGYNDGFPVNGYGPPDGYIPDPVPMTQREIDRKTKPDRNRLSDFKAKLYYCHNGDIDAAGGWLEAETSYNPISDPMDVRSVLEWKTLNGSLNKAFPELTKDYKENVRGKK